MNSGFLAASSPPKIAGKERTFLAVSEGNRRGVQRNEQFRIAGLG
jgi:hypothetical protein